MLYERDAAKANKVANDARRSLLMMQYIGVGSAIKSGFNLIGE